MSKQRWTPQARKMAGVIDEFERSEMTVAEFAQARGFSKWQIYEWRRRIRRLRAEEQGSRSVDSPFVPVQTTAPVSAGGRFELELGRGRRLRVPSGFNAGDLRRLIEVIESC